MSVKIPTKSRLRLGTLINYDGVEFWDLLVLPPIPDRQDDRQYTVKGGDRIDLIAYREYGNSTLWWVIAVANDMELLPTALNVGDEIRIPDPAGIPAYLSGLVVP